MLVSLEQSLAEPADSIIHFFFLSVFACVFQPMVHALKTTQPEELDPLLACLPKVQPNKGVSGQVPSPRCDCQAAFGWI